VIAVEIHVRNGYFSDYSTCYAAVQLTMDDLVVFFARLDDLVVTVMSSCPYLCVGGIDYV
jgi:hypothetical protein